MKPETTAYLEKARDLVDRATALFAQGVQDDAGRAA
jgi:hypothetical protein